MRLWEAENFEPEIVHCRYRCSCGGHGIHCWSDIAQTRPKRLGSPYSPFDFGRKRQPSVPADEYGAQKRKEAEEAAKILQATPHFLPYRDGELTVADEIARELAKLLRKLQPQVVITHWKESIHSDHTATYHLTHRAIFMAVNPHFDLEGLPPIRSVRLYYAENWEDAEGFLPFRLCGHQRCVR